MQCDEFREGYRRVGQLPTPQVGLAPEDCEPYVRHLQSCRACGDWHLAQQLAQRDVEVEQFPCVHMADHATHRCEEHPDPFDCPEVVVVYIPPFDEYGIPARDGGRNTILIHHCPWCGVTLPESKRDRWMAELAARGIQDPWEQEIPEAYKTDRWWREKEVENASS